MSLRKAPADRSNREKPVYPDMLLEPSDGVLRGPELPKGYKWCGITKGWWNQLRESPQARMFKPSDWAHLLDTALLHNRLWGEPELKPSEQASLASEIRRRLERYGFTWPDRRKYGINIADPEDVVEGAEALTKQAGRRSAIDYRKKLDGLA